MATQHHYEITIGATSYIVDLVDNNAKIIWDKTDNGLMFKENLDGTFVLNRNGNETCYDAIKAMTHCDVAYLVLIDDLGLAIIITTVFGIRDIEYNDDRCSMTIKSRYYDPNDIDGIITKDLNIINDFFPTYTVSNLGGSTFEFVEYTRSDVPCSDLSYLIPEQQWYSTYGGYIPHIKIYNGSYEFGEYHDTWSYHSQLQTHTGIDVYGDPLFHIATKWFREFRFISKVIDPTHSNPPPQGTSAYAFTFDSEVVINGITYNKYVRAVDSMVRYSIMNDHTVNNLGFIQWGITSYYGYGSRSVSRARKLNDILEYFATELNCTSLSSQFFKNASNPISGADLTHLMILQKSDAIYVSGSETSDPATVGMITFNELMEQLWAMFQVTWVIKNNILYIEHIIYFKYNFSYLQNTTVGIDLTTYYPTALIGSYQYKYDQNIPIREKFSFMEAWNIDFIGMDIDYTDCLKNGDTVEYNASLITTDLDPIYFDELASKDGFVLLHCESIDKVIEGIHYTEIKVIEERGKLTGMTAANTHLSWANLHDNYWVYNRYLYSGYMNGAVHNFYARKLKKQNAIEFPYCIKDFLLKVNELVKTTMGDGEIENAEYNIKTGNVKVELVYKDPYYG